VLRGTCNVLSTEVSRGVPSGMWANDKGTDGVDIVQMGGNVAGAVVPSSASNG